MNFGLQLNLGGIATKKNNENPADEKLLALPLVDTIDLNLKMHLVLANKTIAD